MGGVERRLAAAELATGAVAGRVCRVCGAGTRRKPGEAWDGRRIATVWHDPEDAAGYPTPDLTPCEACGRRPFIIDVVYADGETWRTNAPGVSAADAGPGA